MFVFRVLRSLMFKGPYSTILILILILILTMKVSKESCCGRREIAWKEG
jgi:hypothetical protein